jgi:S-adenosylmethionine:tRNA ribosyltransferase-isomerase
MLCGYPVNNMQNGSKMNNKTEDHSPNPRDISIQEYDYSLPEDRIAKFPLKERDASKLLIYDNGAIREDTYKNITAYLPEGSSLVFNNTKVVEARILFQKDTGSVIEIFALEPDSRYSDIQTAMLEKGSVYWKCLVGGASKWKKGIVLEKKILDSLILHAAIIEQLPDCFLIHLNWSDKELTFAELLHHAGLIPLPPYLKRKSEQSDAERYQTIYAKAEGSVAAPTAGLHFTDYIFNQMGKANIKREYVTLHVGAGTFKPVKASRLEGHEMHAEFMDVDMETLKSLQSSNRIYAVGTTSLRTLESLYWMGVKCTIDPNINIQDLEMKQWEIYDTWIKCKVPSSTAIHNLINYMASRKMQRIICKTSLLITPGYEREWTDGIITNFHQPQSTLLLLIASFVGDDWKRIYQYALSNEYRFLSYGDGMLIR